jgi:Icc-related predicted phosphoesterase
MKDEADMTRTTSGQPTRVRLLSDLHLEFHRDGGAEFVAGLEARENEILVLAGDIHVGPALELALERFCSTWADVVFVPGNHEYYHHKPSQIEALRRACVSRFSGLHWLDERVAMVRGRRFVGGTLWFGAEAAKHPVRFAMSDFRVIDDFEPWVYERNAAMVQLLERELSPGDVVVTHHLPAPECVAPKWVNSPLTPYFLCDVKRLIEERQPALWLHGHTHEPVDVRVGHTRIVANPFGYRGHEEQPAFRPDLSIPLD